MQNYMKSNKTSNKRALIVSPYLDHLGGGERYMIEAASSIEESGYEIFFAWDDLEQIKKLTTMLGISLKNPKLDNRVLPHYFAGGARGMFQATHNYELIFYLSDGSIPLLGGERNILHIQVPFHDIGGRSITNKLKLLNIASIIVNSKFTKHIIDREYGVKSLVVYPPVNIIKPGEKKNIILSVGRFDPSLNVKRQDVLIQAFKKLSPSHPNWKLVLAGGAGKGEQDFVNKLKDSSTGFPIEFIVNAPYKTIRSLYSTSAIYWHAAGYQINEKTNPELTEHFGITTAEAISAGCIPLVVPKGGQTEIVTDSQYHWNNQEELIAKTDSFINNRPTINININEFSATHFHDHISEIIK